VEVPGKRNQEFIGDSIEAVTAQLIQAQENATKKIESMRNAPAPALAPQPGMVQSRPLTSDERKNVATAISQGSPDGVEQVVKSEFGASPDTIRKRLEEIDTLRAHLAGAHFRLLHPEYVVNYQNEQIMLRYLGERNLLADVTNMETAYQDLKLRGEIEIIEKQPSGAPEDSPARPRQASTGLQGGRASSHVTRPRAELTAKEIRDMSAAEYRKRMGDPAFVRRVNEL
jgi:hypothetical protein